MQHYGERIEKLSQQDKLSKFCMDAGFLNVVEIGQYFMTKDSAEFSQFHAVACREYTLPRENSSITTTKGWIQGNTPRLGPYWKLQPVTCMVSMELRSEFGPVNRDKTHSWVRIYQGSNKFVMKLNNNEKEIPEVQLEEYALKLDVERFCMPIKG